MQQMIIANRLIDGAVVFLGPRHEWVTAIGDGAIIDTEPDAEASLAVAKRHETDCLVVEPALIEVAVHEGHPRPTAIREAIRAFGPTVRTDRPGAESAALEPQARSSSRRHNE